MRRQFNSIIYKLAMVFLCCSALILRFSDSAIAFYMERKHQVDPVALQVISKLSHQPELMNVSYLQYYLGLPANQAENEMRTDQCYYWYSTDRGMLRYKLEQNEIALNTVTDAMFTVYLPDSGLTFKDMESKYGKPVKRFFNEYSFPTEQYNLIPNTSVSFIQPQNAFEIQEVVIHYRGHPLPLPSALDMKLASCERRANAFEYHCQKNWSSELPLLQSHLAEHPEDIEAHCALAQALKAIGHINEAIAEYEFALAQTSNNTELRQKCIAGLKELKVLPENNKKLPEYYELKRVDKGQRFRVSKVEHRNAHRKANPLGIEPIDPPPELLYSTLGSRVSQVGSQQ